MRQERDHEQPEFPCYRGYRDDDGAHVMIHHSAGRVTKLPPRNDLVDHSPTGFEWGYGGSGPAQLALALLADALRASGRDNRTTDREAVRLHQRYKWGIVAGLAKDGWTITRKSVIERATALPR